MKNNFSKINSTALCAWFAYFNTARMSMIVNVGRPGIGKMRLRTGAGCSGTGAAGCFARVARVFFGAGALRICMKVLLEENMKLPHPPFHRQARPRV